MEPPFAEQIENQGGARASAATGHADVSTIEHTTVSATGQDPQSLGGRRRPGSAIGCVTPPRPSCGHAATDLREDCPACLSYFRQRETAANGDSVGTEVDVTRDTLREELERREHELYLREFALEHREALLDFRKQVLWELESMDQRYLEHIAVTERSTQECERAVN